MDPQLRQDITDELAILLNRPPTEQEVQNGQTDTYVMQQVLLKRMGAGV